MDIEETMQFMLEMQAKHEAWLARHEEAIGRIETGLTQLVDVSLSLARGMEELREAQAASEYKLNALIETVDKIVRKNGHDKGLS